MRRLRLKDALLLAGLLAIWGACFALHLTRASQGTIAWIPLYVEGAETADAHPTVRGFWSEAAADAPGLALGDRLLRVGQVDLRGAGRLRFVASVYEQAALGVAVPVTYARADRQGTAEIRLSPVPYAWRKSLMAFALVVVGTLAFWRTRGAHFGRVFFVAAIAYALHWGDFWGGPEAQTYAAIAAFGVGGMLAPPLALRTALLFPPEVARNDRASALWPWLFALAGVGTTSWAFGFPLPPAWGRPLALAGSVAFIATMVAVLTVNYRRSSPAGRRQIKWVVLGFWVGLVPALLFGSAALVQDRLWWLYEASLAAAVAIPISLFIALFFYNLFDIDRLITGAASYTILSILLLAGVLFAVPRGAELMAGVVDPGVGELALTLGVAGAVLAMQRGLERRIAARFFPERDSLERDAGLIRQHLASCDKPSELLAELGGSLASLLRLDAVAIYGRAHGTLAPVYAQGRAVAPAFDLEGPLMTHLQTEGAVLDAALIGRGRGRPPASDAERAALDAMSVEVVLPVLLEGELAAFVCLGEKRSGDLFTSSDRALLQSVVDKAADELLRFNQEEVYREQRNMVERLRRYVPGPLAERLASGAELPSGVQELSILFVDVRGYSSIAERQRLETVFSMINEYTERVSRIVREHGGSVVEFGGDGMMTVFGTPDPLPKKELAALRAAREIVTAVRGLELRDGEGEVLRIDVGVGIATGDAFVGGIRAADRLIWSALGRTTNLAARLQALTRELQAAIAIDGSTYAAARDVAGGFEPHLGRRLRGMQATVDVYALPLAAI